MCRYEWGQVVEGSEGVVGCRYGGYGVDGGMGWVFIAAGAHVAQVLRYALGSLDYEGHGESWRARFTNPVYDDETWDLLRLCLTLILVLNCTSISKSNSISQLASVTGGTHSVFEHDNEVEMAIPIIDDIPRRID